METAQQQHNRISLMRVDSGLEYLRQKQREKDARSANNSSLNQPHGSFIKPTAYVYPTQHAAPLHPSYTNHSNSPVHIHSVVPSTHNYSQNAGNGNYIG